MWGSRQNLDGINNELQTHSLKLINVQQTLKIWEELVIVKGQLIKVQYEN